MLILAMESSCATASVALTHDGAVLAEYTLSSGNTHSVTLLPMAEQMLAALSLTPADIDLYACGAGPGSFTGVRIGAAAIKGLALPRSTPCVGVSTLEALAEGLKLVGGIICPCINARRGQVYSALFSSDGEKITRLTEDAAIPAAESDRLLAGYGNVWFTGDGYDLVSHLTSNHTPSRLRLPGAAAVAAVAERIYSESPDKDRFTAEALLPVYLKKPQAQREREIRLSETNGECK